MTDEQISTDQTSKTQLLNQIMSLRAELKHVSDERDAVDERCAELERYNATLADAMRRRHEIITDLGAQNRKLSLRLRMAIIMLTIISVSALLMLLTRTAAAQTYLPMAGAPSRIWFTPPELDAAQRAYGFDPAIVAEHTWCELDASAVPDVGVIRYRYCFQQWMNGAPTSASSGVLFSMVGDRITAIYITEASGSIAPAAASGCDENGDCG